MAGSFFLMEDLLKTRHVVIPLLVLGFPLTVLFVLMDVHPPPFQIGQDMIIFIWFGPAFLLVAAGFIWLHIYENRDEKRFRRKLEKENDDHLH